MKALKKDIELIRALISKEKCLIQSLKIYIKVIGVSLSILINTKVLVYVILKDLIWKLKFKIKLNDRIRIVLLKERNKIKVIDFILNILIAVQHLQISGSLYIIKDIDSIIILEMD